MRPLRPFFALMWQLARRNQPGQYVSSLMWVFILLSLAHVDSTSGLCLLGVGAAWACTITSGRLSDAGLSRAWAVLIGPTLVSPWLVPALIPGARPYGILLQAVLAVAARNPWHVGLVAALLVFPVALALAPSKRRTSRPVEQ
jgi:uncharacterized membrane protein YhaH (DUF805 family)